MSPDVIVVGAGVIGLSVALRLSAAGKKVCVIDRGPPGAEASSAAAGMLAPQKEASGPGPLLELFLRSRSLYRAFVEEIESLSGISVDYRPSGLLELAFDEASLVKLEAKVAWQKAFGLRADLIDAATARSREPAVSENILGAAFYPDDHQVDTPRLVQALWVAAQKTQIVFENHELSALGIEKNRVSGVFIGGTLVPADSVVIASGAWASQLSETGLSPRVIRPIRGQMVELKPPSPVLNTLLANPQGYLVPRSDGRVIAGSTAEDVGFEKKVTAGGLSRILNMALECCPSLSAAQVTASWAGFRPGTADGLPVLGRSSLQGLFFATGHFRNGILLAPVTARLLTEIILGEKTSVDLQPFRFDRFSAPSP